MDDPVKKEQVSHIITTLYQCHAHIIKLTVLQYNLTLLQYI